MTTSTTTPQHATARLDSLTGLRWLAALAVFAHHFWEGYPQTSVGLLGVTFFFVLSGFVLTWSCSTHPATLRFYRNRVARVVPSMMVAVLAGAAIAKMGMGQLVFSLLGLQAWSPDPSVYYGGAGVVWSLTCELFFYALFPYLFRGLINLTAAQRRWLVADVLLVGVLLRLVMGASQGFFDRWDFNYWFFDLFPLMRLPEFLVGIVLALEVKNGLKVRWALPFGLVGLALVTLVAIAGDYRLWWNLLAIGPVCLLIVSVVQGRSDGRKSWLASRPMIWLGEVSFCFYLFHYIVLLVVPPVNSLLVPLFLASVLVAAAVHYLIEKPFNRLIRGN